MTSTDAYEPGPDRGLERTPPQDLPAERGVLGGMMLSKDAIADVVGKVHAEDFYRPAHETIFQAIVELSNRGEPADLVTVSDELTKTGELQRIGGGAYLADLIDMVPTAANAGFYAEIVSERAVLRRLVEAGTRIVQLGYASDGGEVVDVINEAQAQVYNVTERGQREDFVPLGDVLEPTIGAIEAAAARGGEVTGVPTGFTEFDELTQGLHAGQMVIFAGRPAMGKTTLGMDVMRSAAIHNGMAACLFSLEMDKVEITMRLLSAESQVPMHRMRSGEMDDRDWQNLVRAESRVREAPLFMDDSANMSLMEIRAKCRRLKQQHDLKLVVIDYLQLMSSGKRVESRQQEVSEFSRALKLLAKEIEVPVIAISQLNRGNEQRTDKKPMMSDLRESGSIEQDADLIVLIHREDYYERESPRAGEADLIVAKHRNGATRTIAVAFEGQYSRFKDMAGGGFAG
ncbi:MAG: replicative DNA helicase [Brachybacterium sp.]|nr:replicative DNA helicase [Brachybacterium sp.]